MSGIGFWELIILFLIGLIVLGPKRLPQVANQLGEWIGQAKRMTRVMRRQLEEEIEINEPSLESFTEVKKNDVAKPQFIDTNPNTNERPMKPEIEKNQSPPNTETTNNKK